MSMAGRERSLRVEADVCRERLDRFLARRLGASRSECRRLIESGAVRVNGRSVAKGAFLTARDRVDLQSAISPTDFAPLAAADLRLDVRYEDAALIVVNKPPGMPTHPLRAGERATLANAVVARFPETAVVGQPRREAGLVHRLDTHTSGLLIVARSEASYARLRNQIRSRRVQKRYQALVAGRYEGPARLDREIIAHRSRPRVRLGRAGSECVTEVVSVDRVGAFSLLELSAPRARRHQVRAHLSAVGFPLVGDTQYGGAALAGLSGQFLHARSVAIEGPKEARRVDVSAELPTEFQRVLTTLLRSS